MALRRDALAGAAEMIMAIERIARSRGSEDMVATVGQIDATPGAVNIIPRRTAFTVDLRAMSDRARSEAVERVRTELRSIASARRLSVAIEEFHSVATTRCDEEFQSQLTSAIADVGGAAVRLPSGAGHDGQMMAKLGPVAMLFVRCRGGVSHRPAEYASPADMGRAVAALVRLIERLAQR
jgi:allantoate deiminase